MFNRLAKFVDRHWLLIILAWGLALAAAYGVHFRWYDRLGILPFPIKTWDDVAAGGEFAFLPVEMQSLIGEKLLAQAFPDDLLKSSVVIVVGRYKQSLTEDDHQFIRDVLKPRLEAIRDEMLKDPNLEIKTPDNKLIGPLLRSADGEAALVIMPLKSEFLDWNNKPVIDRVQRLIKTELPAATNPQTHGPLIPYGLDLAMSGSATVGRDMLVAAEESSNATEFWTVALVVGLLALIYFAPFLPLIPLLTVFTSIQISLAIITLIAQVPFWNYRVFVSMEVYITVVVYGACVDYCLFLIARYKEEIDKGLSLPDALQATIGSVGGALTASAFTVICGIGMMVFAQFGKFRHAGIGISLSLFVGLLASLTLAPALLRMLGWMAFLPRGRSERIPSVAGWVSGTRLINRLVERNRFQVLWEAIGNMVVRYPGRILTTCIAVMVPFAVIGMVFYEYLSYGLLSELPTDNESVIGAKAVQQHFPAGYAGPLTVLIHNDEVDFNGLEGRSALELLIGRLEPKLAELGIADIRYVKEPLGLKTALNTFERGIAKKRAQTYYVSSVPEYNGHVTRVDVVFEADPFDRESILQLSAVEAELRKGLQDDEALAPLRNSQFHFVGPTASIRDLKTVTDHDQIKIDVLVLVSVFIILVLLLRKVAISAYLIISVFFSYFVAMGVTFAVFWMMDPAGFAGIDWKVPMFLFTILMAIGEDYNIFLMTRIEEEQKQHGPVEGVRVAMLRTGTIISSCGIVMAGTFMSLFAGTLVGLKQLGFALAFGVLLDTFVVRPLLVPAYLVLLHSGAFGAAGRWLGAHADDRPAAPPAGAKAVARVDA